MRIICLNAWGGKLYAPLLAYLKASAPDVLCLQEVVHSPASSKGWLTYRDDERVLPQRANLLRDICDALPDHAATFCPAAQGVLWDGEETVPSQWGLATFVHKSHPVIGQAQGFVHKDYSSDGFGDYPRSRSAHAIRLYDYIKKRSLSITHMHGLHDLRGKTDTPERHEQAQRLLALSRQVAQDGELEVICGDFNVEPGSETLGLLRRAGMTELVTTRGFPGTRTSHYQKPVKFADYMLINDPSAVQSFDVVTSPEVSDHCPLLLKL